MHTKGEKYGGTWDLKIPPLARFFAAALIPSFNEFQIV